MPLSRSVARDYEIFKQRRRINTTRQKRGKHLGIGRLSEPTRPRNAHVLFRDADAWKNFGDEPRFIVMSE